MSNSQTYSIQGQSIPTPDNLTVEAFLPGRDTPGNVGVCFSGGGTFALVSALGQMRALRHLGYLGKSRAISSVSGGSWATVPFTFLPDDIADDDFLGGFVEDPGELTLNPFASNKAAILEYLTPHNLGQVPASTRMSATYMAATALALDLAGCPADRLWTHIIGTNVLSPFNLASFEDYLPQAFFAYDDAHAQAILAANPGLTRQYHTYHSRAGDTSRPFHICNTAEFIKTNPNNSYPDGATLLAPVQATAFFAGTWGSNLGTDASGQQVGGGALPAFALNSSLSSRDGDTFHGEQDAPLALSDITGMSSAFYASSLAEQEPKLGALDPKYTCWPPQAAAPAGSLNRFADGGGVEDNGVASALAFTDIDKLVVFINTPSGPISQLAGHVVIDPWMPTLYGYRQLTKENAAAGYVLFADSHPTASDADRFYQHNQVFDSARFAEARDGLWANSGSGSHEQPAVFLQTGVAVVDNPWFGVKANGRKVDILWVKTNPVNAWRDQLPDSVKLLTTKSFPDFSLFSTHLSTVNTNLFAHFTSWITAKQSAHLAALFQG